MDDGGRKKPKGICRGVVPGGAGGTMTPPDFGRSVNSISTRGTDYAHLIITGTPRFSDLQTALTIATISLKLTFFKMIQSDSKYFSKVTYFHLGKGNIVIYLHTQTI